MAKSQANSEKAPDRHELRDSGQNKLTVDSSKGSRWQNEGKPSHPRLEEATRGMESGVCMGGKAPGQKLRACGCDVLLASRS